MNPSRNTTPLGPIVSGSSSGIDCRCLTPEECRRYAVEWRDDPNPILRGMAVLLASGQAKEGAL